VTERDAAERVMSCLPASDRARFGPIAILILWAVVSGVISWFVQRMLNRCTARGMAHPGPVARRHLDRAIRRACREALAEHPEATREGLDVAELADAVRAALLAAAGVEDHELEAMRVSTGGGGTMTEGVDWKVHYDEALDAWHEEIKLRQAVEAEAVRLLAERDAIIRLCYHSNESPDGRWFYRLKVDPIDGTEMEIDYDTEAEVAAAVRAAAGMGGGGA
jgi:plasmid stabilization system protein ParE